MARAKKSDKQIREDKQKVFMEMIAKKAGYYRANPQRFVSEIMNVNLRLFQKILVWAFFHYNYIFYIAARGRLALPLRNLRVIKVGKIGEP